MSKVVKVKATMYTYFTGYVEVPEGVETDSVEFQDWVKANMSPPANMGEEGSEWAWGEMKPVENVNIDAIQRDLDISLIYYDGEEVESYER